MNSVHHTPLAALAHRYTLARYRRGEISPATRQAIGYTLRDFAASHGNRPVAHLGPATVDRWLETIAHQAPATRRCALSRVRGFCRWLQADGHIKRDPTAHVPRIIQPHREPVTLTRAEVLRTVAAAPDLRARVILAIMDDVAARCADVAMLRCEDINRSTGTILLRAKGRERRPPISPATIRLIDAYLEQAGHSSGPLIRSKDHPARGLAAATISRYVRRWMIDAGVKQRPLDGRSAHAWRRTCLSEVMEACGDVQVVQELAGHASPETTIQHYLRPVSDVRMRAAMDARRQAA